MCPEYSPARCPPTRAHLRCTLRDATRYQCHQKPAGLHRSLRRRLGRLQSPSTGLRFKALNSYLSPGPFNTNPPINPLAPVINTLGLSLDIVSSMHGNCARQQFAPRQFHFFGMLPIIMLWLIMDNRFPIGRNDSHVGRPWYSQRTRI